MQEADMRDTLDPVQAQLQPWHAAFEADVLRLVSEALKVRNDELTLDSDMADYGEGSIYVTTVMANVSTYLGLSISPAIYFEASSLRELCQLIGERHTDALADFYRITA